MRALWSCTGEGGLCPEGPGKKGITPTVQRCVILEAKVQQTGSVKVILTVVKEDSALARDYLS